MSQLHLESNAMIDNSRSNEPTHRSVASSSKCPVSVVVITKNEAAGIRRCLDALSWCDEVVVVDDFSVDETVKLAAERGARVISHRFESFASQRNWAVEHAELRNDWVLMLDADEVVTPQLQAEIERTLPCADASLAGFKMCRKTMFMGKWLRYSDGFPVWIVRLVRVGQCQFEDSGHGEVPVPHGFGPFECIKSPFLHYPFEKGLGNWIERHNKYSEREAEYEFQDSSLIVWSALWARDRAARRSAWRRLSRRLPCRAMIRFAYQYILKRGFLDGSAGLTFSWLMAIYEGLIVLKRRELEFLNRSAQE